MNISRGLLYPAFHKFYNALSSLEKFEKGQNFFDKIICLDNFFSEYRNITFVLQKSLAHATALGFYEKCRDQYLVNEIGRWFVDKRNEVLKQKPFELEKRISISIYSDHDTFSLPQLNYTIDNDEDFSNIIESLGTSLLSYGDIEVMFCAEFSFLEYGIDIDLYDNLILGIDKMKLFLSEIKKLINEDCKLTDELEIKIEKLNFYRVPKEMLFIDDYVFYCKNEFFEKASRIAILIGEPQTKIPIENFNKNYPEGDLFQKFELMHLVTFQMQKSLLPTCLILYEDETFQLLSFGFSIKTTVYRKFNEIANRIDTDKIVSVLFVTEMYIYDKSDIINLNSYEKVKHSKKEILAFYVIDNNLEIRSHWYDVLKIDDFEYIFPIMLGKTNNTNLPGFMNPIIKEFTRIQ